MSDLQAPQLDTRTFKDLVKEARDRIPRYTPDWTNLNDSDPGMTLVKLQAWLTDTLLFQLNRLPELNYIKFLELLNIKRSPATAAKTELTFTLKKLNSVTDPLLVPIPKNAQVSVDDPDLPAEVIFETDYTLTAINAAVAAIIVKSEGTGTQTFQLITEYDENEGTLKVLHAFYPFGVAPKAGDICLLGLFLRPFRKKKKDYSQDVFPPGQLDVTVNCTEVFETDDQGSVIKGPFAEQSRFAWEVMDKAAALEWEVYVGTDPATDFQDTTGNQECWKRLNASDETAGLQDSGHLRLEIPPDISSVGLRQLPRSFWDVLGLKKPPVTLDDLTDDLQDGTFGLTFDMLKEDQWEAMGVPQERLDELMSCCTTADEAVKALKDLADGGVTIDPAKVSFEQWIELEAGYQSPSIPSHALHWLRARVVADDLEAALINTFLLNTVPATAAVTRLEEQLGASDGRPAQTFKLNRTPIYCDSQTGEPHLELDVVESGESRRWTRVDDFYRQEPDSEVYLLDETTGRITFGDGRRGRIPLAGAQVVARRYRYGGGALGNCGEGSVSKLKSALPPVDRVTNVRAAVGGQDAEDPAVTKLRAPHELRVRDRAVSAEDFALLARETPGIAIQRSYALARKRIDADQNLETADGAVTVVILPYNDQETPQPSEAQLRAVCEHLDPRRLITTELYVTGPRYTAIQSLQAEIRASADADLKALGDEAFNRLCSYFHPLYGGEDGLGWPFGGSVYYGNVYQLLLAIPGVRRVLDLAIELEGETGGEDDGDRLSVPEGSLVHLPRNVINLKVVYDTYR